MKHFLALALSAFCLVLPTFSQTILTAGGLAAYAPNVSVGGGGGDPTWLTLGAHPTTRNNFSGTVGCTFTVSSSITVTSLAGYVISGSSQTHRVGLWNSSFTKLAEISINKSGLSAGFAYVSITPLTLTAGTYYLGEEEFSGGDTWYNDDSSVSTTSAATITFSSFHSGAYDAPSSNGGSSSVACFGPVNFKSH